MLSCALIGFKKEYYDKIISNKTPFHVKYMINDHDDNHDDNYDTMLHDKYLHSVFIFGDNVYRYVKDALMARKHVFCDKLISCDVDEIRDCYAIARNNNLVLFCAFKHRFDPKLYMMRDHLINRVLVVSYGPHDMINIVHDIDYVNWVLNDRPHAVYACKNDNDMVINMEYINKLATITASKTRVRHRVEFYGREHVLVNDDNQHYDVMHFAGAIQDDINVIVSENECMNNLAVIEACNRSLTEKKRVIVEYT